MGIPHFALWPIRICLNRTENAINDGFWEARMDNYQFYSLDRYGRTARPPRVAQFKDDRAALAEARKALHDQTIEIWQGDRCVATLLQMQRVA